MLCCGVNSADDFSVAGSTFWRLKVLLRTLCKRCEPVDPFY